MKKIPARSSIYPLLILLAASIGIALPQSSFENFVKVADDRLMEGNEELRFISFNVPNLHCIEDYMLFEETNPWRMPEAFEIRDALETVKAMGGTVARLYTVTVRRKTDSPNIPRHVLGPGQFNEEAFRVYDQILAIANEVGVRIIIPFVDNWSWMGGRAEYAGFRDKPSEAFWSDKKIKSDFKRTLEFMIERVNTITGVAYRDDKALLAWETGNELESPNDWTQEMLAYIKKKDKNHLVIDGFHTSVLRDESVASPLVDIVTTHHYEKNPRDMVAHMRASAEKAKGKKPYFIGEFGFINTAGVEMVYDFVQHTPHVSGALLWSLRFHARDGGFYWHAEPGSGRYFYKAYHAPGFASGELYDEINMMRLSRERAFAIRGLAVPPWPIPHPPVFLPSTEVAQLRWQGSVCASSYDLERAMAPEGPWEMIARDISDAVSAHRPLYSDRGAEPGRAYYYRVSARNATGVSAPSNVIGPITVQHRTLVDEFFNYGVMLHQNERVALQTENARVFKEDAHRLKGENGGELTYATPAVMQQVRIYLFANGAEPPIELSTSVEGMQYDSLAVTTQSYDAGQTDYNFALPMLVSASALPLETRYLKIRFRSEAQIARVEIAYGK